MAPLHRTSGVLLLLGLLAGLGGCASGPEESPTPATDFATLTVIVWSAQTNGPVAAIGTVTAKADGAVRDLDTRADVGSGCRLTGLSPGSFQVKIARRFDKDSKPQAVDGIEEVYLEPGATKEITVVVTDRGGEVGLLGPPGPSDTPVASPSPLPVRAARLGGG
jgi:hypothetical protein